MKFFSTLLLFLIVSSIATAQQTVWSGANSQDWFDANNWNNGVPTTGLSAIIPSSATGLNAPQVDSAIVVDFQIQNYGEVSFLANVVLNENFSNFNDAKLTVQENFVIGSSRQLTNNGLFVNDGFVFDSGSISMSATGVWQNLTGSTLDIASGSTLLSYGQFDNNSILNNNGNFTCGKNFNNNGTLNNNALFTVGFGGGDLENNTTGIVINNNTATFDIQGFLTNNGSIENRGSFKVSATGQFENDNLFLNKSVARNFGHTENNGIYNNGCATCDTTGIYQYNDYGASFTNNKDFNNFGTLELMPCSEFIQDSENATPITGSVWLMGVVYEISGTVNQENIMGGVVLYNLSQNPAPTAVCKNVTVTLGSNGIYVLNGALLNNNSTATYCEITSYTAIPSSFTCNNVGNNNVQMRVTDAHGNIASCNATVNVLASAGCVGCYNVTYPGTISANQTICAGSTPVPLVNVSLPTGGIGSVEYVWIKWTVEPFSNPNAFTMVPNSNSEGYAPGALTQTTWFRRCARRSSCTDFIAESNIVKITVVPVPNPTLILTQPTCILPSGSLIVSNISSGTNILLDNVNYPNSQTIFTNLAVGTHTLYTAKDGCSKTNTFVINPVVNNTPDLIVTTVQPSCNNLTGSITITNLPIGYSSKINNEAWVPFKQTYNNLLPGTYTISMGLNGCDKSTTVTILPISGLPTPTLQVTQPNCTNPMGSVVLSNLTFGAAVALDNQASVVNQTTFNNIAPGVHTFTITQGQCSTSLNFTIVASVNNTPVPQLMLSHPSETSPYGSVFILNLPTGFSSSLDNGPWNFEQVQYTGLSNGPHIITIGKDGCNNSTTFTIIPFVANIPSVLCKNITIQLVNGQAVITGIQLDNGSTAGSGSVASYTLSQSVFYAAGIYSVTLTVTNTFGQSSSCIATVTVVDPCAYPAPILQVIQPSCTQTTGSVSVTNAPSGSTIQLDGGTAQSTILFSNISVGNHTITVTKDGCAKTVNFSINAPATTPTPIVAVQDASCSSTTGSVSITNLPANYETRIDGGTWTLNKASYTGLAVGPHIIEMGLNDCIGKTVFVISGAMPVPPQVLCKNITIQLVNGQAVITSVDLDNGSTPGCGTIASYTLSQSTFTAAGTYTVTLTVTNTSGVSSSCTALVTVTQVCENLTNPGQIAADQTICSGGDPAPITSVSLPSGGSGTIEYMWIYFLQDPITNPNAQHYPITNATGTAYDPGPLTQTTWFRRCARRALCTSWVGESNTIKITVNNVVTPVISLTQPTCAVASGSVTITNLPANYYSSLDGGAATLNKATYTGIAPGAHTIYIGTSVDCYGTAAFTINNVVPSTPQVLCKNITVQLVNGQAVITGIQLDNGSTPGCGTIASYTLSQSTFTAAGTYTVTLTVTNTSGVSSSCTALVTVTQVCENLTNPGQIAGDQTICSGGDPAPITSVSLPSGGTGTIEYMWIYFLQDPVANPNAQHFPIANSTGTTYDPGPLTQTTWFRRCARRALCTSWVGESNNVKITVTNVVTPAISLTQPTCAVATGSVTITNLPANYYSSLDGGAATLNKSTYSGIAPGAHTIYIGTSVNCYGSAAFTINNVVPSTPQVLCKNITVQLVNGQAVITGIQLDNGSTAGCGSIASYTLSQSTFTAAGTYTVTLTVTNTSGVSSSCTALVTVTTVCQNLTSPGQIAGDQTICSGGDPAPISSVSLPSGGSGTIEYMWIYFLQDPVANPNAQHYPIANATGTTYDPGPLTQTTWFRRCARRALCTSWVGESNNVKITVTNPVTPILSITQGNCSVSSGSVNITNLPSGYSSSLDGGAWTLGKIAYTGIAAGTHTISIGANGCNGSTTFTINTSAISTVFDPTKCYKIVNKVSGKALAVLNGNTADGAQIVQWNYTGAADQNWQFEPTGDGYFYLKSRGTGKVLDIEGGSTAEHAYALQWTQHTGANQQFSIESIGNGYYKIVARHSCKAIKLSASPGVDGTRIFQATFSDTYEHAKWQIVEVACATAPPPPTGSCNKTALFVVGCLPLNSGDTWVKSRLEQLGLSVTLILDVNAASSNATGKGIVVISSTTASSNVGTKFTNVAVPVITWESFLYDDLKMTGNVSGVDYGTDNGNKLKIDDKNHPLAAGLDKTVEVFSSSIAVRFGKPNANAKKILYVDKTDFYPIFGYEAGAGMFGMNAPARRVGFFLDDVTAVSLNANGRELFDAAISWAMNCNTLNNLAAVKKQEDLVFNAFRKDFDVSLKWISNTGPVNDYFVIEHSVDNMNFKELTSVAGEGPEGEILYFKEIDENPAMGDNFYRLRLIKKDGSEVVTESKKVTMYSVKNFGLFPNPAGEKTWMNLSTMAGKQAKVEIVNQMGIVMRTMEIDEVSKDPYELNLTGLDNGFYTVVVFSEGIRRASRLIVSQTF